MLIVRLLLIMIAAFSLFLYNATGIPEHYQYGLLATLALGVVALLTRAPISLVVAALLFFAFLT
jgi:hypothetical protein